LIGSELRERYVTEAQLLSSAFIVDENYMRTPAVDSNISSMQAMMMGLFPFDEKKLTEWQQGNAVPPV